MSSFPFLRWPAWRSWGCCLPFLAPIPVRRIAWLALFTGLALEGAQLTLELLGVVSGYGHSIDINDVILNALGVLAGYGIFRLIARINFMKVLRL